MMSPNTTPRPNLRSAANRPAFHHRISQGVKNSGGSARQQNEAIQARAAALIREQEQVYQDHYAPAIGNLVSRLDDTSSIDRAKRTADETAGRINNREDRQLARYGIHKSAIQHREGEVTKAAQKSINYDDTVNTARDEAENRRVVLRDAIIDLGRGVEDSASKTASNLADSAGDRINAAKIGQANKDAQDRQTATSAFATVAMIAALLY